MNPNTAIWLRRHRITPERWYLVIRVSLNQHILQSWARFELYSLSYVFESSPFFFLALLSFPLVKAILWQRYFFHDERFSTPRTWILFSYSSVRFWQMPRSVWLSAALGEKFLRKWVQATNPLAPITIIHTPVPKGLDFLVCCYSASICSWVMKEIFGKKCSYFRLASFTRGLSIIPLLFPRSKIIFLCLISPLPCALP